MEGVAICIKGLQAQLAIASLERNRKTNNKSITFPIITLFKDNNFNPKLKWTSTVTIIKYNKVAIWTQIIILHKSLKITTMVQIKCMLDNDFA